MPPANVTAATRPAFKNVAPPAAAPTSRLSGAFSRNASSSDARWSPQVAERNPSADSGLPIPCPVYSGVLRASDLPDNLKDGAIFDQTSLDQAWSSVEGHLRTQTLTEEDVLQTLKSGFLQTPTGKALAPLFVGAIMRSVRPLQGSTPERLREFVEVICHLPPDQWADAFGENVNFPRGSDGESVHGFIQSQLTRSRSEREQRVAVGELLDNDTWKAVRDLTQQARQYVRPSAEGTLNEHLRQLEDFIHVRPSPKEAKTLVAEFVQALNEPHPNERQRWPDRFADTAQQLSARLDTIEIVDNRPERSLLEEIIDPESLQASLSKIATPVNAALAGLGSMSLRDVGNQLSLALTEAVSYFVFGADAKPPLAQVADGQPAESPFLSSLYEIENKASFFDEVITTGPRYTGGFWGKLLYVGTALDTVGVLGVAKKVRPYLPAVPTTPVTVNADAPPPATPKEAAVVHPDVASLTSRAARLEKEVNEFTSSLPPSSGSRTPEQINSDAQPSTSSQATPSPLSGLTFEQLGQSVTDALSMIDEALSKIVKVLTFYGPTDAVTIDMNNVETPLLVLKDGLEALEQAAQEEYLVHPPVYPVQQPTPSFWDSIALQLNTVLGRLSTALSAYALGSASTAIQLARDNPGASVTAAFVAVSALYNEYFQRPELTAGIEPTGDAHQPLNEDSAPQEVESPELREERLEDKIEDILKKPVVKGEPALSQQILERMYQSTEHDLLDDEQLIADVARMLQQHSPQAPEKTYLELIHESQAELIHETQLTGDARQTTVQSTLDVQHIRKKRDTESVNENIVSFDSPEVDIETTTGIDESEPDNVAILTQYLKTIEDLQRPDIETDQDIDMDPSESKTETTKQVMRLLRSRRNVGWADASRANGDRQLVTCYVTELSKYADSGTSTSALRVVIPSHSTFGLCWSNVIRAFKNPFFIDWARQSNLNLTTVQLNTADGTLSGLVNGSRTTFTLTDNTGWASVAGPILRTARVLDPTYNGVPYPAVTSSVPFNLVKGFYGEHSTLTRSEAGQRIRELNANQAFTAIQSGDPLRPPHLRSEASVAKQQQQLGDLYTNHQLTTALTALIAGKSDDARVSFNDELVAIHPDSLFKLKYPAEGQRMVSAQRYISAMGWTVPKNAGEVRNLVKVLTFALPESSEQGNYQGALGHPRPPTAAQKQTILETVQRLELNVDGLLGNLLKYEAISSPAQGLDIALNSDKAKRLGRELESDLDAITSPGSAVEWVMAALLLDLDPTPGLPRNHVAGYNLTQAANWGATPSTVVSQLESHLVACGKVSSTTAPVAAYHLLASFAPEFLVRDLPGNLVCGSHTWASFRIAVARIEQIDPGASIRMTFEQVMDYGSTQPISVGQEIATQSASVDPLVDWAVANGIMLPSTEDAFSPSWLRIAGEKFDSVRNELALAQNYLTSAMPTREGLALAELERVFGKGLPYNDRCLRDKNIPQTARASSHSLLDLYITGQLEPGKWKTYNAQIPIHRFEAKFSQLKPAESLFEERFTHYFDNLRIGSASIFKHLISQLPLEDRQSLEYGRQNFYSLRSAIDTAISNQTPDRIEAHKGRHGILIRSQYKQNITYYEVFPTSVEIRKRTDLPVTLQLGGEIKLRRSFTPPGIPYQEATSQPFDWNAYKEGKTPRNGVMSDVIIEEINPPTQPNVVYPPGYDFDRAPDAFYSNSRVKYLASVVIDEHFLVGREALRSIARGSTDSENEEIFRARVLDFFLSLVPFKSCIDNIRQGNVGGAILDCALDAAGFVIPGGIAARQAARVASSGARFVPKALKMSWIMTSSLVSSANPFDGAGGLLKFGKNAVCTLGTQAYRAAGNGIDQIKNIYGSMKAIDRAELLKRADIADGVISAGATGQTSPVKALFKEGKWYAFDVDRNRAYGSPLENFRLDSSIALERTPLPDGSNPFVPTRIFDTEPHTIKRMTGTDVVVGDKVYRYDPAHPEMLNDITSPAYFKQLDGFEQVCEIGKRQKRDTRICFSKVINNNLTPLEQRVQAIEHKRLYPTTGEQGVAPRVIHERRIYKCDANFMNCNPDELNFPLEFKPVTTGGILPYENFGYGKLPIDTILNQRTRTVKINSIVNNLEDSREVRAMVVDVPGAVSGKTSYLVAEADTGLFYYCRYNGKVNNHVEFIHIKDPYQGLGMQLVEGFHQVRDPYIFAAGTRINNDFATLPTLDSLYKDPDFSLDELMDFQRITARLSDQQKRELIVAKGLAGKKIEVVIPAIKLEPIPKPADFAFKSRLDQNGIYADSAQLQVKAQIAATGLGPANQKNVKDLNDMARQSLTEPLVIWQYEKNNVLGPSGLLVKTGSGNCDQMAEVAAQTIKDSGGTAAVWGMDGHTYTLVGDPVGTPVANTLDFSEPAFVNMWISDPWAGISCPAKDYVNRYTATLRRWETQGKLLFRYDGNAIPPRADWLSPMDPYWINGINGWKMQRY